MQLSPEGLRFFQPVRLEIFLSANQINNLNQSLAEGMVLFGFHYKADGDQLSAALVEVSDDHSILTLQLHGFSGAGAAPGNPINSDVLGIPDDPAAAAQQAILQIIYPPEGGAADLEHPLAACCSWSGCWRAWSARSSPSVAFMCCGGRRQREAVRSAVGH